ncbi:BglG family transcription antiterminator [Oceanobacillus kimchii]|uniref:BglG family transcription antiterminator n=1 Tax=Oceanobacillus kimchii TaxID=746691 RepID=UPI0021A7006B|nr:BglG family transcription antiterminator [Oceanobacillus kimchii]MCT1578261.1 BglG family transcription antiterminator [Oceanobacillus kimchii]MCT2134439.1 BglG family transcription antiterminator [Oceanobacillus kimchii]
MLGEREEQIFNELIKDTSVTSSKLAEKYNLSRRQLGYTFQKINHWLTESQLPEIERTRKGQFIIDQSILTATVTSRVSPISNNEVILSEVDRVKFLLIMILGGKEPLSLAHFTSKLFVSKNTILNDMKQAQKHLDSYQLAIQYSRKDGYQIEGDEFQARKVMIWLANDIILHSDEKEKLHEVLKLEGSLLEQFHRRLERVENKLNIEFTDEKLMTMPTIFSLILRRIRQGFQIQPLSIRYDELSNTKEYQATEEILYDKSLPVPEKLFITLNLLTGSVHRNELLIEDSIPDLVPAIDKMVRLFEKNACIIFQDREQLIDKLLQHLTPAYYRIKYKLTDAIVFESTYNEEFEQIRHLIKRALDPISEVMGSKIPENEITYIVMLVSGWMHMQGESMTEKVKAIVVCPQGVSVSRLMFHQLKELFPEFVFLDSLSVREFLTYGLEYDVVFSPIALVTEKNLFISKTMLRPEDKQRLRKQVMLEVYDYIPNEINVDDILKTIGQYADVNDEKQLRKELYAYIHRDENAAITRQLSTSIELDLHEFLIPEYITLREAVPSFEDAIRLCAEPLLKSGHIEQYYVEAAIQHSQEDSYIAIGPHVAIPHAAPEDGVRQVGMSLLRIKNGVKYGEEGHQIKLMVMIAAVDKQQHIHALMQLMKVASSETILPKLVQANSKQYIHQLIEAYVTGS